MRGRALRGALAPGRGGRRRAPDVEGELQQLLETRAIGEQMRKLADLQIETTTTTDPSARPLDDAAFQQLLRELEPRPTPVSESEIAALRQTLVDESQKRALESRARRRATAAWMGLAAALALALGALIDRRRAV